MTNIPEIEIMIDDPRWAEALPEVEDLSERAVTAALAMAKHNQRASLSVLLADDTRVAVLNRDFRNINMPTNVLSFPALATPHLPDEIPSLGDIALAFETLEREASLANRPFRNHYQHLIVHASLHLIGYTHDMEEDAERMESLEIAALKVLGIPNPYEEPGDRQTAYGTREP